MRCAISCAGALVLAACGRVGFEEREPDARAPAFCAALGTPALFCEDFEDGSFGNFAGMNSDLGAVAIVPAAAHASHFGLEASTQMLASGDNATAELQATLATPITSARFAFDLDIATAGTSDLAIGSIDMDDGMQMHIVEYVYRLAPGTSYIEDVVKPNGGSSSFNSYPFESATPATWHRVEIDFTTGTGASCTVLTDGTQVLATPLVGTTGGAPQLDLGAQFVQGPAAGWAVDLDNVVVDAP
ncbi:MAG TPA: hypothetical protein VGF94_25850 [Kofleriaceae bacterium]|jgi:hypothetical protein